MSVRVAARVPLLALALTNGILYVCMLPLWEGFDEPFHYAYVQSISVRHRFPVMNQARLSKEIRQSLNAVPLSRLLSTSVPGSLSFEEWARLSEAAKLQRATDLCRINPVERNFESDLLNYEAQQAPLTYVALAPFDLLLSHVRLKNRILILRLLGTAGATLLLFVALTALNNVVGLKNGFEMAAIACVLESQMLWASVAHVGNDLLAVPLTVCFLAWMAISVQKPNPRHLLLLAFLLAAGLLVKAYFLAFVPVFVALAGYQAIRKLHAWRTLAMAIVIVAVAAAPWYTRNLLLYGSLSGTQQSVAGIGVAQAFDALGRIHWIASAISFARWSLWTGNWSFLSFSKQTLDAELILLLAAFGYYLAGWRRIATSQIWILAACASFLASLVYQTCVTWVHTNGTSMSPEPWYAQGVIACLWILCFVALQSRKTIGKVIATGLVLLSAWVAAATYFAKLLPYYGDAITRSSIRAVWSWWRQNPTRELSTVLLGPVWAVYVLLTLFTALLLVLTAQILLRFWTPNPQD